MKKIIASILVLSMTLMGCAEAPGFQPGLYAGSATYASGDFSMTWNFEIDFKENGTFAMVDDSGAEKGVGTYEEGAHKAAFFTGDFVLTAPTSEVTLKNIERQGFMFFAGELAVEKTFTLAEGDTARELVFEKAGLNAIRVNVNGTDAGTVLWAPYSVDLTPYLKAGENTVKLTLVNNLRNLLGPHHHVDGELLAVAPPHFYKEACVWNDYNAGYFTEKYSFVHTSLE